MRSLARLFPLLVTLVPALVGSTAALDAQRAGRAAGKPQWQSSELPGGVALHVLQVPDAPAQSTFTIWARGLAADPVGQAQFSHLAEHAICRSTDPGRLFRDGMAVNGETTSNHLRVETLAAPANWRDALRRHARWVRASACPDGVAAKEAPRIALEERSTVENGATGKWAIAAWSQAVAGREHAAVHGDVAGATDAQVTLWMEQHLAPRRPSIFSIGPVAADVQQAFLASQLGAARAEEAVGEVDVFEEEAVEEEVVDTEVVESEVVDTEVVDEEAVEQEFSGAMRARVVTWDLQARHRLVWWRVPEAHVAGVPGRAAMQTAGSLLMAAAMQAHRRGRMPATAELVRRDDGWYLVAQAPLGADDDPQAFDARFRRAVEGMAHEAVVPIVLRSVFAGMQWPEDLAPIRERMGPQAAHLETNLVLPLAMMATLIEVAPDEVRGLLEAAPPADVVAGARLVLGPPAGACTLEPRERGR